MNNSILLIIFVMTIIIGTCLNVKIENFNDSIEHADNLSSTKTDTSSTKTESSIESHSSVKVEPSTEKKQELPPNVTINKPDEEKYYDYKYTINNSNPDSECKQQPININLNYPIPPPKEESNVVYKEPPYNNSLLQNLAGTPADQVQTSYSVVDDNMYKSWDNYYLPGYSYFPPSTWQLPRENSYIIPKEMKEGKCDVCPLTQTNEWGNYLSGDNLPYGPDKLPPIPDLPDTTRVVEKKIVTKKIKKT